MAPLLPIKRAVGGTRGEGRAKEEAKGEHSAQLISNQTGGGGGKAEGKSRNSSDCNRWIDRPECNIAS